MIKRADMRIRDPYIVPYKGVYYVYKTVADMSLVYFKSTDLENWEEGGTVFSITEDSWATRDLWASEIHEYKSKFYLFTSSLGRNGLRGTQVSVSETPEGPFIPLKNGPLTPEGQSCIDGTLYVDDSGVPYIVYSHDWPDNYIKEKSAYVGEICAAQVDEDLVNIVGEPFRLFASDESPISYKTPHNIIYKDEKTKRYGSDGPWIEKLSTGGLFLAWSPYLENNYVVLPVISESGDIRGPWKHLDEPFFADNGGHAMFFRDFDGSLKMALHAPEAPPMERMHIFNIEEKDGTLAITEEV